MGWFPLAPGEVYVPGYHVSRGYVNQVNITNTNVNVTKVTNVYNTTIINKSTTINNVTYVNQHVNNAVTVVNHDTFVNARPVAQNVVHVDPKQIANAPVSRVVAAEPVRTSVVGAGRAASARPPAAVAERKVVAVKAPPPLPRPIEQRQAQAGGHLNEQALVRPAGPTRPAPTTPTPARNAPQNEARPAPETPAHNAPQNEARPAPETPARPAPGAQSERQPTPNERQPNPNERQPAQEGGFRPFTPPNSGNQTRPAQPNETRRAEQGNAQPENRPPQNRLEPTNQNYRESQRGGFNSPEQTHPLVRPTPPVQQRSPEQEQQQEQKFNQWRQQKPSSPPPQRESRPSPPPRQEKPNKKGH